MATKKSFFLLMIINAYLTIEAAKQDKIVNVGSIKSVPSDVKSLIVGFVAHTQEKEEAAKNIAALGCVNKEFNAVCGQFMGYSQEKDALYPTGWSKFGKGAKPSSTYPTNDNVAFLLKNAERFDLSENEIRDIYNFMNIEPTWQEHFYDVCYPCVNQRCYHNRYTSQDYRKDYARRIKEKYNLETEPDFHRLAVNFNRYQQKRDERCQCIGLSFLCVLCPPCACCVLCCL